MKRWLSLLAKTLSRFGLWMPALVAGYLAGPFGDSDREARGRMLYGFLMAKKNPSLRGFLTRLIRRDLDRSSTGDLWLAALAQAAHRPHLAALISRRVSHRTNSSVDVASARMFADLTQSLADGSIYERVAATVDAAGLSPGQSVVLVPVGSRYLELFRLWLELARKHVAGRVTVLALDLAAAEAAAQLGLSVLDLSPFFCFDEDGKIHDRSRNALWILRVLALREIVARGHVLISLDLDALVRADLAPLLASFPEADIVAQQDYSIPVEVARKFGFILCCGFMCFRPTEATQDFLDRYAIRTMHELDDQLALNHMLADAGIADLVKTPRFFTFRSAGVLWVCPDKSLVSRDIASGTVVRHFQQQGQTNDELRALLGIEAEVSN
jgi:hypothetical protein